MEYIKTQGDFIEEAIMKLPPSSVNNSRSIARGVYNALVKRNGKSPYLLAKLENYLNMSIDVDYIPGIDDGESPRIIN